MRTRLMIMVIVLAVTAFGVSVLAALVLWLGWAAGLATGCGLLAAVIAIYLTVLKPWHMRWGATDEDVNRAMPGDDLISGAGQATRAITIRATPKESGRG